MPPRVPFRDRAAAPNPGPPAWGIPLALLASVAWFGVCAGAVPTLQAKAIELQPLYRRVDSLSFAGRRDQALEELRVEAAAARARKDREREFLVEFKRGGLMVFVGDVKNGEPILRQALPLAEAIGDTTYLGRIWCWLGTAASSTGRWDESAHAYERGLSLALAVKDPHAEAQARLGLAYYALNMGDQREALRRYRLAFDAAQRARNSYIQFEALTGIGRAFANQGEIDSARVAWRRVVEASGGQGFKSIQGNALNNLGGLDQLRGDTEAAIASFSRALNLHRSAGNLRESLVAATNLAKLLTPLHREREANALLDSLAAECRARGYRDLEVDCLIAQGNLYVSSSQLHQAAAVLRTVLATPELSPSRELSARMGLADALDQLDSTAAAVAALEVPAKTLERAGGVTGIGFELTAASVLAEAGRHAEALDAAQRALKEADRIRAVALAKRAATFAARSCAALGRPAEARAYLDRAVQLYEAARTVPVSVEWRTRYSSDLELAVTMAAILLPASGSRGPASVWDRLQDFKSRTLLDWMARATGAPVAVSTDSMRLEDFQRDVLRDGEVFLDPFVGPDTSFLFAVTPTAVHVTGLPGWDDLYHRIQPLVTLLQSTSTANDPRLLSRAARPMAALLPDSMLAAIDRSRRVLIAPDGPFHSFPLDLLPLRPEGRADSWLGAAHEVAVVPSAAVLASLRRSSQRHDSAHGLRVLALASGRNPYGESMPGAVSEVRRLREHYSGVVDGPTSVRVHPEAWGDFDVVHLASHAEIDVDNPWRSKILVDGPPRTPTLEWVRAEEVMKHRLRARLVVLSACSSARGRVVPGEGRQGLAIAFMMSGAQAVVATYWPVDDRVAARMTATLYERLAAGATVGAALHDAKRLVARSPETSAPVHWAGFVVLGDPDVRVPLRRRPPFATLWP